jgi:hypothetical protein
VLRLCAPAALGGGLRLTGSPRLSAGGG